MTILMSDPNRLPLPHQVKRWIVSSDAANKRNIKDPTPTTTAKQTIMPTISNTNATTPNDHQASNSLSSLILCMG